jgi:cytochrome c(L)
MKAEKRNHKAKGKRQRAKIEKALGLRLQALGRRIGSRFHQPPAPSPQPLVLTLTFLLCLLLSASPRAFAQQNGSAPQKNPYTGNAAAIAEGKELYKKMNCYGCHGMQGGGGMGPSLIDEAWKAGDGSDRNLLDQIRNGKGQMPPYKTMVNDDQAWKLIAFIRSLYKGDPKKMTW